MATNIKRMVTNNNENSKIMYKDLSYKLQGLFFDIRNDLGSGHKESIYQKALTKDLTRAGIKFTKEPSIKIFSQKGEFLGLYRPDFLIEDKIIVELKAVEHISRQETARVYDYLRNSEYELAYLINFASPRLFIKRLIFTNDRKIQTATNSKRIATNLFIVFVVINALFVVIRGVSAAELKLLSSAQEIAVGQQFKVDLLLNTENEIINAVEGKIVFPADLLEMKELQDGNSIINFWIEKLSSNNNELVFSGIIPGGYNDAEGFIFSAVFEAKKEMTGVIEIKESKILLNDGKGTQAKLSVKNFSFVAIRAPIRGDSWVSPKDTEQPEAFSPQISHDPNIFDNKWFLVFATQDKGSGIERYEVQERRESKIFNLRPIKNNWIIAESPYQIQDQNLHSIIYIRAIDKSGNERMEMLLPQRPIKWYEDYYLWGIIIILVIIPLYYVIRKNKKRN